MYKYRLSLLLTILHVTLAGIGIAGEQIIQTNGIDIWCEDFGKREDPPILLIMGCDCQGIMWHDAFCEKLADQGYFVIRYDHRDCGLSTTIAPENRPYDLLDMAKDAVGILDYYQLEKAHILGASMGGLIAQLLTVNFPERVETLCLLSTSCDFSVLVDSFEGKENTSPLSKPASEYLGWVYTILFKSHEMSKEEKVKFNILGCQMLNGPTSLDWLLYERLYVKAKSRSSNPYSILHHFAAIKGSLESSKYIAKAIKVPTVVLHGTEDVIFPLDHGQALAECIEGATCVILDNMGHSLNPLYYDSIIRHVVHLSKAPCKIH